MPDPTTPPVSDPTAPPADPVVPDPTPPPAADPPAGEAPPADPPTLDLDAALAELAKTRREAAKYRTGQKAERESKESLEQQLSAIAKAIGGEDPEADPAKLAEQLEGAKTKFREERTSNAILTAAAAEGADIEMMRYYLIGSGALQDLDVEADDFPAQVAAKVKSAVASNPKLKAGTPGPGSGDQGPRGGSAQLTGDDLKDMTPEQVDKARQEGRLDTLLGKTT